MVEVAEVRAVDLSRCAVVFAPALLARESRIAFWDNECRLVARMSGSEALPVLGRARSDPAAHPTLAFWGRVALVALRLVTQGNALCEADAEPGSTGQIGQPSHEDEARIRAATATMPTSTPGRGPRGGDAEADVRFFLNAFADATLWGPVGAAVAGGAVQLDRFGHYRSRTTRAFASIVGI
jgi:hypothetical protein